jgi:vancomycin resistance protein VanJ
VLSYNIRGGTFGFELIKSQIDRCRPDVVVFSEALGWADDAVNRAFYARQFPGWSMLYAREVFIASRWPMVEEESRPLGPDNVKYQGMDREAGHAVIQAPFGRFHVFGAHFYTSMHGWTLRRERRRLSSYLGETAWARRVQADELCEWIPRLQGPVILAGDFNTPPTGNIYRDLTRILSDSFREAGTGWGYTFPSDRPVLRIDYVLHSRHWTAVHSEVGPEPGSDHRPLFTELALTRP